MVWVLWVILAFACASLANRRGRSYGGWLLISLLLSPLVGFILLLVSSDLSEQTGLKVGTHKKCYQCAEIVKKEAIKCKHCGAAFHDNDL